MAVVTHRVWENYIYQIESISPTLNSTKKFSYYDPLHFPDGVPNNSDSIRRFIVEWNSDTPMNYTSMYDRHDVVSFSVIVFYPHVIGRQSRMVETMFSDRFDIIKRLRDTVYLVGYSASFPTTSCGQVKRQYEGGSNGKETFEQVDSLNLNFTSHIFEVEGA